MDRSSKYDSVREVGPKEEIHSSPGQPYAYVIPMQLQRHTGQSGRAPDLDKLGDELRAHA